MYAGGKQLDPVAASEHACTYNSYIYICRQIHKGDHPVLGQPTDKPHCPHCLCTLCVVAQPPDFLVGSSAASFNNVSKRYSLYRKFWALLWQLGVWEHPTYTWNKTKQHHTPSIPHHHLHNWLSLLHCSFHSKCNTCFHNICVVLLLVHYKCVYEHSKLERSCLTPKSRSLDIGQEEKGCKGIH